MYVVANNNNKKNKLSSACKFCSQVLQISVYVIENINVQCCKYKQIKCLASNFVFTYCKFTF